MDAPVGVYLTVAAEGGIPLGSMGFPPRGVRKSSASRLQSFAMSLVEQISSTLGPHLGQHSADAVARHTCAKLQVGDSPNATELARLREYLRRGLVAYVGATSAEELAARCVSTPPAASPEGSA